MEKAHLPTKLSYQNTRRAHLGCLALALILAAVLPSFACYKIAFLKETESLVKGTQLLLARQLQQRPAQMWISTRRRALGGKADYWSGVREFRRTNAWSLYFQGFLSTTVRKPDRDDPSIVFTQPFEPELAIRLYRACRPLVEEEDLPTRGLLASAADDGSWHNRFESNQLVLTLRGGADPERPEIQVRSQFPTAGLINGPWPLPLRGLNWRLCWYAGLLAVAAVPFALAGFIGRRILLLNFPRFAATQQDEDYDCFWRYCPDEQKRTLYQIAKHGFVHPDRSEDMKGALDRGWVRFDPELGMEQKFREYVVKNFREDVAAQSLSGVADASPLHWLSIRGAVGIAITAIAIFLFATQAEACQLVVAFTGAFATIAQQLPKLGWFFGEKKPSE